MSFRYQNVNLFSWCRTAGKNTRWKTRGETCSLEPNRDGASKALDEVIKHSKFIDERYDELLRQIKTSNEERKALWLENKVLKKMLQELQQNHTTLLQESNEKNQYDQRECLDIRGIPQPD